MCKEISQLHRYYTDLAFYQSTLFFRTEYKKLKNIASVIEHQCMCVACDQVIKLFTWRPKHPDSLTPELNYFCQFENKRSFSIPLSGAMVIMQAVTKWFHCSTLFMSHSSISTFYNYLFFNTIGLHQTQFLPVPLSDSDWAFLLWKQPLNIYNEPWC